MLAQGQGASPLQTRSCLSVPALLLGGHHSKSPVARGKLVLFNGFWASFTITVLAAANCWLSWLWASLTGSGGDAQV